MNKYLIVLAFGVGLFVLSMVSGNVAEGIQRLLDMVGYLLALWIFDRS